MIPKYFRFGSLPRELTSFFQSTSYSQVAVLVDENTERSCYSEIQKVLPAHFVIKIASGEEQKHLGTCDTIWLSMTEKQMDRRSLMINLGGGVISDMGGFCAATFKRGIDYVNIPTTLLSQVDASIGGKVGVDFKSFKNHIGLFRDPTLVIADVGMLDTLPYEQIRSGFAEVVKHALIADSGFFEHLKKISELSQADWRTVIPRALEIKGKIVESDPLEKGPRKKLNFGHSVGHAIESCLLENGTPCLHGEAVGAGMLCEAFISSKANGLSHESLHQIKTFITAHFPKNHSLTGIAPERIAAALLQDKKNRDSEMRFTLLKEIGMSDYDITISFDDVLESLKYYEASYP